MPLLPAGATDREIAARFDPFETLDRVPYAEFAALRRLGAVIETEPAWVFVRKDEVEAATHDLEHLRASFRAPGVVIPEEEKLISEIEEPRHGKVRRILNSAIAHHKHEAKGVADSVRELSREGLSRVIAKGGGELMAEFIAPIPINIICRLIGVPSEDWQHFRVWTDEIVEGTYATLNANERGEGLAGAHPEFATYLDRLIADRRKASNPPDNMVTRMIKAEMDGDRLTNVEIRTQLTHILIAGNETTRSHIGSLLHHLIANQDLLRRIRADRGLIERAVDESLRFDPPVTMLVRTCINDTDQYGVPIRQGDKVVLSLASANRDELYYEHPHEFSLDRPRVRDHLTFGSGPHICPGSSLARLESRVVLDLFLDSVREVDFANGFEWKKNPVFWANGPDRLEVEVSA